MFLIVFCFPLCCFRNVLNCIRACWNVIMNRKQCLLYNHEQLEADVILLEEEMGDIIFNEWQSKYKLFNFSGDNSALFLCTICFHKNSCVASIRPTFWRE